MGKVISFGYSRRALVPAADKVFDARDFSHDLSRPEVSDAVEDIVKNYVSGQTIAIGCDKGRHRAPEIARRLAERLGLRLQHRDK